MSPELTHPQPDLPPSQGSALPPPPAGIETWLRRYRRYIPIPLCLVAIIWLRPALFWGSVWLDALIDVLGVSLCMLGQGVRLWAWGSNADVGKFGVRARGPYALMRYPLYVGNFFILLGLVIIFNNPWAYLLFLLPFAYLYHVITDLEEKRMQRRFGADYQGYRQKEVPRFLPAVNNLPTALRTTLPFGWGLAWRKEYESCCGWLAGIVGLQLYEGTLTYGWAQYWPYTQRGLVVLGLLGIIAFSLWIRKSLSHTETPS